MNEASLFAAALEKTTPGERQAWLDQACGDDLPLRRRMEVLLTAHERSHGILDRAAVGSDPPIAETAGTVIGLYQLGELIGEGGMGLVFVAEQMQPVRRTVALKIIKPGMDTREVIARFEAERQALALMDHPNISTVLDAGTTESGRPFFVMELVRGVAITEHADRQQLTTRERLALFVSVCQAVQHAHHKGIIHRDLKPSNVLVTLHDGNPVVKVIDFGVAKAVNQQLTQRPTHTRYSQIIGTPIYMSPEQAEMSVLDVDTRTDIYSLGVLLYELLTGSTPFDRKRMSEVGIDEMRRIIREEEPEKPSTRGRRKDESGRMQDETGRMHDTADSSFILHPSSFQELDWIVMKALEKDRTRRYQTANDMARDVQRYLNDEPVEASPPSTSYRLRKFLRRNRRVVLAASLLLMVLLAGIIGTTWGLIEARSAEEKERLARQRESEQRALAEEREKRAIAEKLIAEGLRTFLLGDLLGQADPWVQAESVRRLGGGFEIMENPTIKELLDRTAVELTPAKLEARLPGQREVQASILRTVGETYRGIGEHGKAVEFLVRARDIYHAEFGNDHPQTLSTQLSLSRVYRATGQLVQAIALGEQVRDALLKQFNADHAYVLVTLNELALAYLAGGRASDAVAVHEKVRDARIQLFGANDSETLMTLHNLGLAYLEAGKLPQAVELLAKVRDERLAQLGPQHTRTLSSMHSLASAYRADGKLTQAIELLEKVREGRAKQLKADHPEMLSTLNNLATTYYSAGNLPRAIALYEQVRVAAEKRLPPDHPLILTTLNNLAAAYRGIDRTAEAIALYEKVREVSVRTRGATNSFTLNTMNNLAEAYRAAGKLPQAIALYEQVRDASMRSPGPNHPDTLITLTNLAVAYAAAGRTNDAVTLLQKVRAVREKDLGADHPSVLSILNSLGWTYRLAGKLEQALPYFQQAATGVEKRDFLHEHATTIVRNLSECHELLKQFDRAEVWRRKLLALVKRTSGAESIEYAGELKELGENLLQQQKHIDAESVLRECLTLLLKLRPTVCATFQTQSLLGAALLGQKKFAEAEPLLLSGYQGVTKWENDPRRKGTAAAMQSGRIPALERLVRLYEAWDKKDEAMKWRKESQAGHD